MKLWMRAGKIVRDESGGELIEFALCSVVLLTVIFGVVDCSRALYSYHFVAGAAREATRYASVRGATWTSALCVLSSTYQCAATPADVTRYVQSITPLGFSSSSLNVATAWPGTTAAGAVCNALSINNSAGCLVNVTVSYSFNFALPFLPKNTVVMTSTSKLTIAQ